MERYTRSYLQLTKPGITLSNTIAATAGLLLGMSQVPTSWQTAIATIVGTAAIIAAACVINNVIDRDIDRRMKRTSKRAVATGQIAVSNALVFAGTLGAVGFSLLGLFTNLTTLLLGVLAVVWYIVIYGYAKRRSEWSTIIGGVTGALPLVAGYTAATGRIDVAAILLFLILFFWQMPHFYAIAIFRKQDYRAGSLPVWTVKRTVVGAKLQMLLFAILFALTGPLLSVFGYTGILFALGFVTLALYWALSGLVFYRVLSDEKWARRMFGLSLMVLMGVCGLIAIGGYIP